MTDYTVSTCGGSEQLIVGWTGEGMVKACDQMLTDTEAINLVAQLLHSIVGAMLKAPYRGDDVSVAATDVMQSTACLLHDLLRCLATIDPEQYVTDSFVGSAETLLRHSRDLRSIIELANANGLAR